MNRCYSIALTLHLTVEAESKAHARTDLRELYLSASDGLPRGAGCYVTNAEWNAIIAGLEPDEATPVQEPTANG